LPRLAGRLDEAESPLALLPAPGVTAYTVPRPAQAAARQAFVS